MQIQGVYDNTYQIEEIEEQIRLYINPILQIIQNYLKDSGIKYNLFKSLYEDNVEIIEIVYESKYEISKQIKVSPYLSCLSLLFNVIQEKSSDKGGIQMRYKKVSDYNEMSAIEAFITEVINKGDKRDSVIEKLIDNFKLSKELAEKNYIEFLDSIEVEQGIFENRKLKIRENPGFLTTINTENFTNNIVIKCQK